MKKNKIIFSPGFENAKGLLEEPEPSIKFIPEWYKKLSRFYVSNNIKHINLFLFLDPFIIYMSANNTNANNR